jgi:signal transduction histidine kinase
VILAPALLSCACILILDNTWLADLQSTKELKKEIDYDTVLAWAQQDLIAYRAKTVAFLGSGDKASAKLANWERHKILDAVKMFSAPDEDVSRLETRRKLDCQFLMANLEEPGVPMKTAPKDDGEGWFELFSNNAKWATQIARRGFLTCSKVLDRFDEDSLRLEELAAKQRHLENTAQSIVWVGIASSVLLALAMVAFYAGWMNRRLAVLLNNARLLGSGAPMTPLPGQDELAFVNSSIQQVDAHLMAAAQQRKSVIEMVAHDVRSPLNGANISLALIEKQSTDSKTRSVKSNAAIARVNLRATVKFVEELLKSEQEAIAREEKTHDRDRRLLPGRSILQSGLFKKLLVLVLVPLVMQIACLSFLYAQISATQSLSLAQERQIEMLRTSAQIIMVSVRMLLSLSLASFDKDEHSLAVYQSDYQKDRSLLSKAISETPLVGEKQFWQQFQHEGEVARNLAEILQQSEFTGVAGVLPALSKTMAKITQLIDTNRIMQELEHDYLSIQAKDLQERMRGIQNFIIAGLAMNIGIAFLLVVAFSSNVNRRLKRLMANVRFCEEDRVYVPAGGDDEIYQLDEAIRNAKQEVRRAEEQRQFILLRVVDNIVAPLTVAATAIEDIDEDVKEALSDSTRENLESSLQSICRVRRLVEDLSHGADSKMRVKVNQQEARLPDILTQAVKSVQPIAEQKKINLVDSSADVHINADSERMIQVFTNLLSNAIKFSPEGASVQISSCESNGQVTISVKDEGAGMDPSDATKIFDRRFQTDQGKSEQGFGLGLSIAREIVEAHGGIITVESEKGIGSTFSVSLPKG